MQQTFDQATETSLKLRLLRKKQEYKTVLCSVDSKLCHQKTRDALTTLICPKVSDTSFLPWKCVMGCCLNCPKYTVPKFEDDILNGAPCINFTRYEQQSRCTLHVPCDIGIHVCRYCPTVDNTAEDEVQASEEKFNKKKQARIITKKLWSSRIGSFIPYLYIPVLKKCRYHFSHKKMLSKIDCNNQQHNWKKNNCHLIKMHMD
jgi:hypothetical protein